MPMSVPYTPLNETQNPPQFSRGNVSGQPPPPYSQTQASAAPWNAQAFCQPGPTGYVTQPLPSCHGGYPYNQPLHVQVVRPQIPQPVSNTVIVTQAAPPVTVVQPTARVPTGRFMAFAIIVTILFNPLFGAIAIVFAILADGGPNTERYNSISLLFCVLGLFSGIGIWVCVLYFIAYATSSSM